MKFDVICVGSAVLDIYLKSPEFKQIPSGEFEGGVALCEAYGGKVEVEELAVTTGGGGTNAAVSFARKNLKTAIICEMGKDLIGETVKRELVAEGVDVSLIVEEAGEQTGLSSIMVSGEGGRSVAVYRGASKMLSVDDVSWDRLDAEWIYLASIGGQMELIEKLLAFAKEKEMRVAWNPGKSEIEALGKDDGKRRELLAMVEVLLVNREEAELLTGTKFADENVWKSEECVVGPAHSVITDGEDGGKACFGGKCVFWKASGEKAIERTGAGDGFGSGVVAGLILGRKFEEALEWGNRQAASVVSFMGPKRGLLTREQIEHTVE